MHIVFANGEYDAYLIEIGSHIYDDDEEFSYYISGALEDVFLSIEFEQ